MKINRIAQLILEKDSHPELIYQTDLDGVKEQACFVIPYITKHRGAGGLGSTGIK
jgi:dUTPase